MWEVHGSAAVKPYAVAPQELDLPRVSAEQIKGGSPDENAATLRRIFEGEAGPVRDVVLLNSAAVIMVGGKAQDLQEGIALARDAINSGEALRKVDGLVELSQELGQA